jgi:hypothetical protein
MSEVLVPPLRERREHEHAQDPPQHALRAARAQERRMRAAAEAVCAASLSSPQVSRCCSLEGAGLRGAKIRPMIQRIRGRGVIAATRASSR